MELYRTVTDRRMLYLTAVLLALTTVIDGLDSTVVNVALPTITDSFGIEESDSSWISVAYMLVLASFIIPLSKIVRNGWIREALASGVLIFTLSSVACGFSRDLMTMIVFRVVQGFGAALMTAAVPHMVVFLLPDDRKGFGMAVLGIASGIALVLGPPVGGFITSFASWDMIFFINVPIGIILLLLTFKVVPRCSIHDVYPRPDFVNSVLSFLFIFWSLTVLQNLVTRSFDSKLMYVCIVCAAVSFVLMFIRVRRRPETSVVPVEMIRRVDFKLLALAFTMTTMVISGMQYVLPFFLQKDMGFSASESGMMMLIPSIATILLSGYVGRWCDSRGCRVPSILAGVFRLAFCLVFAVTASFIDFWIMAAAMVVMGCSMSFAGTGLATALIHHSDEPYKGDAATLLMAINYAAASIGVACFAFIFTLGGDDYTPISSFTDCSWLGVVLSVVAIVCAFAVSNIIPKKDR